MLTKTTIQTPQLDKFIQKMDDHISQFYSTGDRRERFLLMYRTFKNELRKNIQKGRFADSEWTEAICCRMAEMYFEAYEQYEKSQNDTPQAWRVCFDTSIAKKNNLLQDALLGMNAHINYDLPICVYDIMIKFNDLKLGEIPIPFDRGLNNILQKRYFDFLMINQIAWESIELITEVLCERFSKLIEVLNQLSFKVSKKLVEQIIVEYRDKAWGNSILLLSTKNKQELKGVKYFVDKLATKNILIVKNHLTFNPYKLINTFRGKSNFQIKLNEENFADEIIHLLIDKLRNKNTSDFAFRTLFDYGNNIVPYLKNYISIDDIYLREKIIKLLYEINSAESLNLLSQQFQKETNRDLRLEILKYFSERIFENRDGKPQVDKLNFNLQNELKNYFRYIILLDFVRNIEPKILFKELIEKKIKTQLKFLLYYLAVKLNDYEIFQFAAEGILPLQNKVNKILHHFESDYIQLLLRHLFSREIKNLESLKNLIELQIDDQWEFIKNELGSNQDYLHSSLLICAASVLKTEESLKYLNEKQKDNELKDIAIWSIEKFENKKEENRMLSSIEKVLHFKNVSLFQEVPAEFLINLARSATEKSYKDGEMIIEQGSTNNDLVLIIEGKVTIKDENGNKITTITKNSVAGEMSLLTDSIASANCIAETKVRALIIPHKTFKEYLMMYTEISYGLMKVLAQKLDHTNKILSKK